MNVIFALLSFACIIMLILGLIKPSIAVIGFTNKTRGKVLLIYGTGLIISFIMLGITTPDEPKKDTVINDPFRGELIYETTISGDASLSRSLADMGLPSKTIIEIGENCFQCTEIGGLTDGTFIKDTAKYKAWFLDYETKTAIPGSCADLDENATDLLKKMYPYTYGTEMEATNDTLTICGYKTQKYKIIHSSFVRDYATAYVWITKDLRFPLCRYDFQTENKRMVTPLPLSLINNLGAILQVVVNENGVEVTYTATRVITKNFVGFDIPDDYTVIHDSAR